MPNTVISLTNGAWLVMTNQLNKYHLFDAINSCTCQGSLDRNDYVKTLAGPVDLTSLTGFSVRKQFLQK